MRMRFVRCAITGTAMSGLARREKAPPKCMGRPAYNIERPSGRLEAEQRLEIAPEDPFLLLRAETRKPLHPRHRRGMPGHERPVAAEHHAIGAYLVEKEAQRLLASHHGVVVEPALIGAGRLGDAARLGSALPAPIETAHGEAGRAAAVGDTRAEFGT